MFGGPSPSNRYLSVAVAGHPTAAPSVVAVACGGATAGGSTRSEKSSAGGSGTTSACGGSTASGHAHDGDSHGWSLHRTMTQERRHVGHVGRGRGGGAVVCGLGCLWSCGASRRTIGPRLRCRFLVLSVLIMVSSRRGVGRGAGPGWPRWSRRFVFFLSTLSLSPPTPSSCLSTWTTWTTWTRAIETRVYVNRYPGPEPGPELGPGFNRAIRGVVVARPAPGGPGPGGRVGPGRCRCVTGCRHTAECELSPCGSGGPQDREPPP